MQHPSQETLKRFAAGTTPRREGKAVVAHLLKGCAECSRKLASLTGAQPVPAGAYDEALERFLDSSLPSRRREKGKEGN